MLFSDFHLLYLTWPHCLARSSICPRRIDTFSSRIGQLLPYVRRPEHVRPGKYGELMPKSKELKITRRQLIEGLNEDLSREYQAIISYVTYSQVLKGAAYMNIADELAVHAKEELSHALKIANHVDYLGGMPSVFPKPVKTSEKAEEMLRFDLENEKETVRQYRRRVKQADLLNEFAIAESLRDILVEEQDHLIVLATALGIDPPDAGISD
jgi:bacterioferritin